MSGCAYREQVYGPVDYALSCGSIGSERASVGTGEGASLSEPPEGLVDGLDTMAPGEVRRLGSVGYGVLHTVQDDPSNAVGEH